MTNPVSDLTWATSGYDPGQGVSLEKMDFAPVLAFGAPEVISHTDPADKTTTVSGDTVDQIFAQTGAPSLSQKIISTAPSFGVRDISGFLVNQGPLPDLPNSSPARAPHPPPSNTSRESLPLRQAFWFNRQDRDQTN